MSKRNWFVITSRVLKLAALTGILLVTGCKKGEGGSMPGVTDTEIKIGQTMPLSGPASAYSVITKTEQAYFKMVNEKGGINGRKINLLVEDDGYAAPKTVEKVRKLVENDGVAFIFNSLGTAPNTAIQSYLNQKKVPQLFVATGADKWADPTNNPWTMGWQPSYRIESRIYAKYLMQEKPDAKLCILYQNDDFGKDYIAGIKDGLGDKYDKVVIKTASYEPSDPTADSQVVTLQAAGCDALLTAAIPKYAAQVIRKVYDIGWKPLHFLSNVAVSRATVLEPAGLEKCVGIITGAYLLDPSDPTTANDPGMNEYRAFMKQWAPELNVADANSVYGFGISGVLVKVLTQAGKDLSRENIMKQAAALSKVPVPVAVPGVEVTTSATDFRPISQMQLAKFNGTSFERFGAVLSGD